MPHETFERLEMRTDDYAKPITILLDNQPIGLFVLDYGNDKFEMTANENALLLRSLSINPLYQGKGYGKVAMLLIDNFVKENFLTINELVLAVNFKNKAAYDLYVKVGYIDDGLQREWHNGMQHLLKKKL